MKRREFLSRGTRLSLSVGVGLLAACTSTPPPSTAPTTAPAAPPTQPAAATTAPGAPAATSAPAAAQPTTAPAATAKPASSGGTLSKLPTFAQPPMPTPELAGSGDGLVDPGYLNYPKQLIQAVKQPPGTGGPVNLWFWIGTAPVPPMDQNPPWQEVNKAVNATLNITFIPFADFNVRWSTLQSGNDMPDITVAFTRPDTAILPAFLDARCADLTPYLSADAIKEYPNLAGLPTRSWKSALINGKLYGVPVPLRPYFWWFWTHQEILDRDGLSQPKSAAEFKQQAVQLTNPQAGVWAIAGEGGAQYAFNTVSGLWSAVYGAPNYWAVDSAGKFTSAFESEQFKQCVVYATDLVKSGVYDPNTLSYNTLSARTQFMGRRAIYRFDGLPPAPYWGGTNAPAMDPPSNIKLAAPFSADGTTTPLYFFGRPNFSIALIKKSPEPRVRELLRILDWFASPFGSQEYHLKTYGIEGRDFNFNEMGNPIVTDLGRSELVPWGNLAQPAAVLFDPQDATFAPTYQGYQKLLAPLGVEDASIGSFSLTNAQRGAILLEGMGGGTQDIIAGRRPMSDYDGLLREWRSNGGNQIKEEMAQSYAQL
jgi:putative aldouronate transport system substrate-binding protein